MNPVRLTDHAIERMKERMGLRKSAMLATAQKAYDVGLCHSQTKGKLRRYVDKLYLDHGKGNSIRIHGTHVFIFHQLILITVLHLPHDLERAAKKLITAHSHV